MPKENIYNVPNLLSGYRLLSAPYVVYIAFTGEQNMYVLLLAINVLTDILDGIIARRFGLQTKFGARLDSLADAGTYIGVASGIASFKWHEFSGVIPWLWVFGLAFALPYAVSYIRFRKLPSLHLYSSKIGGTLDGIFLAYLFLFGFSQWLFFLAVCWGILSFIEMTAVVLTLKELKPDCKGIYRTIKERQREPGDMWRPDNATIS